MRPVAVGNPHTRLSLADSSGPVKMTSNGATTNGSHGAKRILPHLDDLVIAKPDVDINSPLRTILLKGELLAKQADTHLDFRRPDIALQEYVCASTIAVDIVPRHPDYLALQKDRGDLHRLYIGLNKRINAQHKKFAEVKELVKADNARSGVLPTVRNQDTFSVTGLDNTPSIPSQPKSTGAEHMNGNSGPAHHQKKAGPVVQPKPEALHGRAISHSNGTNNVSDLAARFARLQNGVPTQDPRIKTRPISVMAPSVTSSSPKPESRSSMIRPLGPRELPAVPTTQPRTAKVPLDVAIPGMPRPPDAIHHSPLRTVGNADTNSLPSSASRNPSFLGHTRKDSAPPISTVGPSPYVPEKRSDYFASPTHSNHDNVLSIPNGKPDYPLPESTTITAEDLMKYLQQGQQTLKVLIVDLRNREDFESGHILSQFTICVEPVTLRSGISGQELEDSMIIGPSYEQELFEQRADFDLLVFYDQSSASIKHSSVGKDKDSILRDFSSAVYDYGYEKSLKRRPVLLAGGLDSWVDLLGPNCLTTSRAGGENIHPGSIINASTSSKQFARRSQAMGSRKRLRPSRLVSSEEERKWDHVLREDSLMSGVKSHTADTDELFYARTPEDFLRRFPELPPVQESMVSPATVPFKQIQHELDGVISKAPARPAPALPRQRSYGIMDKGASFQYTHAGGSGITNTVVQPGLTGLKNMLGVQCYMNAAVQMISATPALRAFLTNLSVNPGSIAVPAKAGESGAPLQLMGRSLGNLLSHMWSGQYNYLSSKTFCSYVNALHCTDRNMSSSVRDMAFGGRVRQHDSAEFLAWVLNTLEDETNPRRNAPQTPFPANNGERLHEMSEAEAAREALRQFRLEQDSPVTAEMGSLTQVQTSCRDANCAGGVRAYTLQTNLGIVVVAPSGSAAANPTFKELLDREYNLPPKPAVNGGADPVNTIQWTCSTCGGLKGIQTTKFARMPNTFFMPINRTNYGSGFGVKLRTIINFEREQHDLSAYCVDFQGQGTGPEFTPPYIYDIISISEHIGDALEFGHYITYSKIRHPTSGQSSWWKFNDSVVTQSSFREATAGTVTYVVLQRRRNAAAA